MNDEIQTSIQSGPLAPAKLKLDPAAFHSVLAPIVEENPNGWTSDQHQRFFERLIPQLKDESGDPVVLQQKHWDALRLIIRPSEEYQLKVFKHTFDDAGYELIAETEGTLTLGFNAAQFSLHLSKIINPLSGKPFITLKKKRGVKKDRFAALVSAVPVETAAEEPEEVVEEEPAPVPDTVTRPAAKK